PPPASDRAHPSVGMVEERLQLVAGEGAVARPAFEIGSVGDGVPLMADLGRHRPEAVLAFGQPPIAGIADIVLKEPEGDVVKADRGMCEASLADDRRRPLLDILGGPLPR